ncbi:MAG: ABC transporter substrate-binding protein [Acidimicrobiales bacterium]|nr:ABC transporter substrate-binding protein [Acidimicrobiales bacterium]
MRKSAVLLAAALLVLAAACKTTDPDDGDAASSTTATAGGDTGTTDTVAPIVDDRAPGVTDDTLKVGVTYPDFEALGDAVNINHGDYEGAYQAVADDINARGGIHGRQLELSFAPVDPSSPTSTDDTCTQLTQDDQVFVAIGLFYGESVLCYVNVNETAVIGGEMTDERLAQARAPWFAYDVSSDSQVDGVQTLIDNGDLTTDQSLAVLYTDVDQTLYEDRIQPVLEDAGIDVVETAAADSSLDPDQVAAEAQTIFQRFEASDADTVLALGSGTAAVVSEGLEGSDYSPQVAFNSTNAVNAYARDTTHDASVFEGAVGVGVYGPPDAYLELGGITETCLDVTRDAGLEIVPPSQVGEGEPNQIVSSLAACQQLALLSAILDGAGEDLNYGTFQTAGYNLGDIELPGEPEPFHYGPPPSTDGDRPLFRYEFDIDTRQFEPAS